MLWNRKSYIVDSLILHSYLFHMFGMQIWRYLCAFPKLHASDELQKLTQLTKAGTLAEPDGSMTWDNQFHFKVSVIYFSRKNMHNNMYVFFLVSCIACSTLQTWSKLLDGWFLFNLIYIACPTLQTLLILLVTFNKTIVLQYLMNDN